MPSSATFASALSATSSSRSDRPADVGSQRAARLTTDAHQLGGDDLVPGRELHAEARQHAVEPLVGERQRLGVGGYAPVGGTPADGGRPVGGADARASVT